MLLSLQGGGDVGESGDRQLVIQLSQGQAELQEVAFLPVTSGEPLTDEEIEQILARLPALAAEPEDQVDFQLPEDSPPPPRTGETIEEPFPPPPAPVMPGGRSRPAPWRCCALPPRARSPWPLLST